MEKFMYGIVNVIGAMYNNDNGIESEEYKFAKQLYNEKKYHSLIIYGLALTSPKHNVDGIISQRLKRYRVRVRRMQELNYNAISILRAIQEEFRLDGVGNA